jgi:hypothetical protein
MPQIVLRPKHQVTLPAHSVPQAKSAPAHPFDLMAYAGIAKNLWGKTTADTDQHLRDLRS